MKKETFYEGMAELTAAFDMKLNDEQTTLWYKYTKDLTDAEFKSKVKNCILTCKHKPYIADLLGVENTASRPPIPLI
jgi:hypothetical protein